MSFGLLPWHESVSVGCVCRLATCLYVRWFRMDSSSSVCSFRFSLCLAVRAAARVGLNFCRCGACARACMHMQLLLQSPPPRRLRVGALRCRVLVLCVAVGPAWNREFCVRSALRGALCARLVPLRFVRTVRSLRGCRVRAGRVRRGSFGSIACVWFSAFSGSAWNREFCVFVWFRVAPGGARAARVGAGGRCWTAFWRRLVRSMHALVGSSLLVFVRSPGSASRYRRPRR